MKKRVLASVIACVLAFQILGPLEQTPSEGTVRDHSINSVTVNSVSPQYGTRSQSSEPISTDS